MSLSTTDKLGSLIGDSLKRQEDIAENLSADDEAGLYQIQQSAQVALQGTVVITAKYLATTSFVIDHPVYGELDSDTLALDGGYASEIGGSFTFPGTFPMTFGGGTPGTEVLFTKSF